MRPFSDIRKYPQGAHRLVIVAVAPALAVGLAAQAPPPSGGWPPSAACVVSGAVSSGTSPLPGVALYLVSGAADVASSSSDLDGRFAIRIPAPGTYTVRAELTGFAPASKEVAVGGQPCEARLLLALSLRSRVAQATPGPQTQAKTPIPAERAGGPGGRAGGRFQNLAVTPDAAAAAPDLSSAIPEVDSALQQMLPPGFSPDAPTEAVSTTGNTQVQFNEGLMGERAALFAQLGGDPEALAQRMVEMMREAGGPPGLLGGLLGGPQGPGGGGRGGGPGGDGPGGGGFPGGRGGLAGMRGANRVQGNVNYTLGGSALDASPYGLNGRAVEKADYVQQRYGSSVGGPLKIPDSSIAGRARPFL